MSEPELKLKWFAIEITVEPEAAEAIEYAFNSLESLGTEINHLRKSDVEGVTVIGYFNDLPDDEIVQDEIHYALRIYGLDENAIASVERHEVVDQDWLVEWKKHWKPSEVAGFIISPPWETPDAGDKIVIFIEPNMAFGTGTHETTQLCLTAIDKNYVAGESFLDIGTGTGILSIAAAKLNAAEGYPDVEMYACDTDNDSILIAIDNAKLNGVADTIDFHIGPITDATPEFDFVCANLTLDVILPNLELILSKSKRILILSGILVTQQAEILAALASFGHGNAEVARSGEWISVTVKAGDRKT
ncbi:MAG: 50S ribosomal protein L11 methyltransferase [Acidobacteriota bacterium]